MSTLSVHQNSPMLRLNRSKENLSNLSNPPTEQELRDYEDVPAEELPSPYKRNILDRIFVNRDLRLDRIKWFGFDMDYTLAQYNSPAYEELSYDLIVQKLIQMGYPATIEKLKYNPSFPIRGLLLDTQLGHLLKVDLFGHVLCCIHGHTRLQKVEIAEIYPSLYIPGEAIGHRYYALDTLFNLPEACLYADLVVHLEGMKDLDIKHSVVDAHTSNISYMSLFQDIRSAMDYVHIRGELKSKTLEDLPKYVKKIKLAVLLDRLRKTGIKLALVTNSDYFYTDKIMNYLLETNQEYKSWRDFYDVIIVSARKPAFFGEGTTLREVNIETGNLKIGTADSFLKGHVYSGGSLQMFEKFTGARGNQVLYVGDHIYADIIKSKKAHALRNLLIIPELEHELKVWNANKKGYNHLANLEYMKAETFRNLDSESTVPPDFTVLRKHIKSTIKQLDDAYNPYFGSLFRSGNKHSQFSMQVMRYADLYTYDVMNLLNYPLFYHFSGTNLPLSHEYVEKADM